MMERSQNRDAENMKQREMSRMTGKSGIGEMTLETMAQTYTGSGGKDLQRTLKRADSKQEESKVQVRDSPRNKVIFIIEYL